MTCRAGLLLMLLCFLSTNAQAVIIVNSQGNANFQGQVLACFERFKAAGGETAAILNGLSQPSPASHTVTLEPTGGGVNTTTPASSQGELQTPNYSPGSGSDSTVDWNPNNANPFADGTPRDPCASLLHELKHAQDFDKGVDDTRAYAPTPQPGWGIPTDEVDAAKEENRYRKKAGLPQRGQYGPRRLPPGAIF